MDKSMITFVVKKSDEVAVSNVNKEIIRKGIHSVIAIVPFLATINKPFTIILLLTGIITYLFSEYLRISNRNTSLIARFTNLVSRDKDKTYPVMGPFTLGIGALLSLILFPLEIASIAIFILAFGDGIASIAGNKFSSIEIPYTQGKTFAGSFACFIVIYLIAFRVTFSMPKAFLIAVIGTFLEALPIHEFDNIVLPVGVGFIVYFIGL